MLPTVRGLPWWGAVLLATGLTALGAVIDATRNESLGATYNFFYLVGCVAAALAVRRRALFTAAAQPPLIAFVVSIVTLYQLHSQQASSNTRSLIVKVLIPIATNFPWMAVTFLITLALVLTRWYLTRSEAERARRRPGTRRASKRSKPTTAESDGETTAGKSRPRSRTRGDARAAGERPAPGTRAKSSTAQRPRSAARPKRIPPRTEAADAPSAGRPEDTTAAGTLVPPRPKRATAGQVLREAGRQIEGENARPSVAADLAPYESSTEAARGYPNARARNRSS